MNLFGTAILYYHSAIFPESNRNYNRDDIKDETGFISWNTSQKKKILHQSLASTSFKAV